MADDFTEAELATIKAMGRASVTLPDDFFGVAAVQELAVLITAIRDKLTDEQAAMLIGIGAYLMEVTRDETIAGIEAAIAIQKARSAHP